MLARREKAEHFSKHTVLTNKAQRDIEGSLNDTYYGKREEKQPVEFPL